jgi:hypothetical protein
MQHIRLQPLDQAHETRPDQDVGRARIAADGETVNAKLEAGRDLRQRHLGAFAAGEAVGDNADVVPTVCLSIGEIQDVTDDSADRRVHRVQDTKRPIWNRGHDQSQRLPTSPVSPGLSAARSAAIKQSLTAHAPRIGQQPASKY